ncbi:hypothetical protein HK105_200676 [Polyrhizophydium stewartii]|uniref:DUF4097 domain-containing protein n=1 Tax=Polyrhizophydium stewartii TaxID=2732419 RepID=A0ABR4NK10_9FUNG
MTLAPPQDTIAWPLPRAINIAVTADVDADITVQRGAAGKAATLSYSFDQSKSTKTPSVGHSLVDGVASFSFTMPFDAVRFELGSSSRPSLRIALSVPDELVPGLDLSVDGKVSSGIVSLLPLEGQLGNVAASLVHTGIAMVGIFISTRSSSVSIPRLASQSLRVKTTSFNQDLGQITVADPAHLQTSSGTIKIETISTAGPLDIESTSGDVVGGVLSAADRLGVKTSSGKVKASAAQAHSINIESTSGNIKVDQIRAVSAVLQTSSGDIKSDAVETQVLLDVKTTSGKTSISRLGAAAAHFKSNSGGVNIETLTAGGTVTAKTTSGDIVVRDITAHAFEFESSSGSVKTKAGIINKASASATSGNVVVDLTFFGTDATAQRDVVLSTSSGNVKASVAGYMRLDSQTSSGDNKLEINPLPGSQTFAKSSSGNTKIDVSAGFNGTFKARGDNARIRGSDFVLVEDTDNRKSGSVGNPEKDGGVIEASASSGSTTITF